MVVPQKTGRTPWWSRGTGIRQSDNGGGPHRVDGPDGTSHTHTHMAQPRAVENVIQSGARWRRRGSLPSLGCACPLPAGNAAVRDASWPHTGPWGPLGGKRGGRRTRPPLTGDEHVCMCALELLYYSRFTFAVWMRTSTWYARVFDMMSSGEGGGSVLVLASPPLPSPPEDGGAGTPGCAR